MNQRVKERLFRNATALYKEGGYAKVVSRFKKLYGEDKEGLTECLALFNKHMEVLGNGRKSS